jgi:hypothetical protein
LKHCNSIVGDKIQRTQVCTGKIFLVNIQEHSLSLQDYADPFPKQLLPEGYKIIFKTFWTFAGLQADILEVMSSSVRKFEFKHNKQNDNCISYDEINGLKGISLSNSM